ncbi:MAG: spore cortex biosynthesis protein YabQ [Oscillospiraceae bacterium]|nr:spore cortex biosynthesis protein YabQ [Oscillospiraceae bacterium]
MELDIGAQGTAALISAAAGFALGIFYDILGTARRALRLRSLTPVADLLFCLAAGTVLLFLGLWQGEGSLRLYMLLFLIAGAAVWFVLFSPLAGHVFRFTYRILGRIWLVLTFPSKKTAFFLKKVAFFCIFYLKNLKKRFTIKHNLAKHILSTGPTEELQDENQAGRTYYMPRHLNTDSLRGGDAYRTARPHRGRKGQDRRDRGSGRGTRKGERDTALRDSAQRRPRDLRDRRKN